MPVKLGSIDLTKISSNCNYMLTKNSDLVSDINFDGKTLDKAPISLAFITPFEDRRDDREKLNFIPITFRLKELETKEIKGVLRPNLWISDYPILAYQRSPDEISVVNLMHRNEVNNQVVFSLAPYIFRCFVETEV